jgi:membrane-bound serine protease (ClpP class)
MRLSFKIFLTTFLGLFLAIMPAPDAHAQKQAEADDKKGPVYIIPIRDQIEKSIVYVVRRGIHEAAENNATAIILHMDTPGGEMGSMMEIMDLLENFKGMTITYVDNKAYSAGAFIAVATKKIYMAPSGVIGAAAPILASPGGGAEEMQGTLETKISSASAARIRASAQRNGHNSELVEAMVRKTGGLKIDGKTIVKEGDILTLTHAEATQLVGKPPKPLLAEAVIDNMDELIKKLGYQDRNIVRIEPTGVERIARLITMAAPILLLIGFGGIYLEFKTPGITIFGIVGAIALTIFFFGHYIAGLSGQEEILLFALGLILIGVEIFILPGHILPGLFGVLAVLVSILWAMIEKFPGGPTIPALPKFQLPLLNLGAGIVGAAILVGILARWLPKTKGPLGGLITQRNLDSSQGFSSADTHAELLGLTGETLSSLRPSGTARFGDTVVDVISEGEFIAAHEKVTVQKISGARVLVRRASGTSSTPPIQQT